MMCGMREDRSATKRLIETLTHLKTPGYRPDRLGLHPAALVGLVCGFGIVIGIVTGIVILFVIVMLRFLGL